MGQHRNNPNSQTLQMVGANVEGGPDHSWYYGKNHDYLLALPSGEVVAEVCMKPSPYGEGADSLWFVTWIEKINEANHFNFLRVDDKAEKMVPPHQHFFVSRTAARMAVNAEYGLSEKEPSRLAAAT